jgi:hypothetical protein
MQVAIAIGISIAGLALSGTALYVSLRRDKVQRLIAIHEKLIDPEIQAGRRILYAAGEDGRIKDLDSTKDANEWDSVNRSIAMFDVFGFYREKAWIPPEDAMALWRDALRQFGPPARAFIARRTEVEGWKVTGDEALWPYFQRLLDAADEAT